MSNKSIIDIENEIKDHKAEIDRLVDDQRKEYYEVLHEAALNYNEDIVSSILDLKDAAKAWVRAVSDS